MKKILKFFDQSTYYVIKFPTERIEIIDSAFFKWKGIDDIRDFNFRYKVVKQDENISLIYLKFNDEEFITPLFYLGVIISLFIYYTKLGAVIFGFLALLLKIAFSDRYKKVCIDYFLYRFKERTKELYKIYEVECKIYQTSRPDDVF